MRKKTGLYLKFDRDLKEAFKQAAEKKGVTMTSLFSAFMRDQIKESDYNFESQI